MAAYTLPKLLAEWENIGATEPFPMAAAEILLRYMNCTASEDGEYEAGISMRGDVKVWQQLAWRNPRSATEEKLPGSVWHRADSCLKLCHRVQLGWILETPFQTLPRKDQYDPVVMQLNIR
jgi:hypothetical protein